MGVYCASVAPRIRLTTYEQALMARALVTSQGRESSANKRLPSDAAIETEALARTIVEALVEILRLLTEIVRSWDSARGPVAVRPPPAPPPRMVLMHDPWASYGRAMTDRSPAPSPASSPPERVSPEPTNAESAPSPAPKVPVAAVPVAAVLDSPHATPAEARLDSPCETPSAEPPVSVTSRTTKGMAPPAEARRVTVSRERKVVWPLRRTWLSAEVMAPHTAILVACAVRDSLDAWRASRMAPTLWRDAIEAAAAQRPLDPRGRLTALASTSARRPRVEMDESATEDSLGAVGRWAGEIGDGDGDGHLAALDALDALSASGVDARGRIYEAAAETWRRRLARPASSRGLQLLLDTAAARLVDSLRDGATPRARLYARIVGTVARWVHPHSAARIEWFARFVAEPLRAARTDVTPVHDVLTPSVREWFALMPVLPVTRVADLFRAMTLADLERCIDPETYDECARTLLLQHGVEADALANIPRCPAVLPPRGDTTRAPLPSPTVAALAAMVAPRAAVLGHVGREHGCRRSRGACEVAAPPRRGRSARRARGGGTTQRSLRSSV